MDAARRSFLKKMIKAGFAFLAMLFGAVLLRFLYPSRIEERGMRFHYIANEEDLPRQGVKRIELTYERDRRELTFRAFLVNSGGEVFALSSVCTHLGCLVNWSRNKNRFVCPCHGGKYDMNGNAAGGPPSHPLARIPIKVRDGKVYIGLKI